MFDNPNSGLPCYVVLTDRAGQHLVMSKQPTGPVYALAAIFTDGRAAADYAELGNFILHGGDPVAGGMLAEIARRLAFPSGIVYVTTPPRHQAHVWTDRELKTLLLLVNRGKSREWISGQFQTTPNAIKHALKRARKVFPHLTGKSGVVIIDEPIDGKFVDALVDERVKNSVNKFLDEIDASRGQNQCLDGPKVPECTLTSIDENTEQAVHPSETAEILQTSPKFDETSPKMPEGGTDLYPGEILTLNAVKRMLQSQFSHVLIVDVMDETGQPHATVGTNLSKLCRLGYLDRISIGKYRLPGHKTDTPATTVPEELSSPAESTEIGQSDEKIHPGSLEYIAKWMIDVEAAFDIEVEDGRYVINGKIRTTPEQFVDIANRERKKRKLDLFDLETSLSV